MRGKQPDALVDDRQGTPSDRRRPEGRRGRADLFGGNYGRRYPGPLVRGLQSGRLAALQSSVERHQLAQAGLVGDGARQGVVVPRGVRDDRVAHLAAEARHMLHLRPVGDHQHFLPPDQAAAPEGQAVIVAPAGGHDPPDVQGAPPPAAARGHAEGTAEPVAYAARGPRALAAVADRHGAQLAAQLVGHPSQEGVVLTHEEAARHLLGLLRPERCELGVAHAGRDGRPRQPPHQSPAEERHNRGNDLRRVRQDKVRQLEVDSPRQGRGGRARVLLLPTPEERKIGPSVADQVAQAHAQHGKPAPWAVRHHAQRPVLVDDVVRGDARGLDPHLSHQQLLKAHAAAHDCFAA
mmetsp:Transcript_2045/g.6839  ORF Transcript_2045/g.6839 Transcript_2045/m.6839 type:complete len:350 (-) Transcript_2045:398-1447(-)